MARVRRTRAQIQHAFGAALFLSCSHRFGDRFTRHRDFQDHLHTVDDLAPQKLRELPLPLNFK